MTLGYPVVCGFTNLPIESGEVGFMIIKRMPGHSNLVMRPFDFYSPATPLVFCDYQDDGYGHWSGEEGQRQRDNLRLALTGLPDFGPAIIEGIVGASYDLQWNDLPSDHFPWFIRKDVYDELLPNCVFEDWVSNKIAEGRLSELQGRVREKIDKRLQAAVKIREILGEPLPDGDILDIVGADGKPTDKALNAAALSMKHMRVPKTPHDPYGRDGFMPGLGLRHTLEDVFRMGGEGRLSPAMAHTIRLCEEIEGGSASFSLDDLHLVCEGFYSIHRLFCAMAWSRRSLFPHYCIGPQSFEPKNHILIADFVKQICEQETAPEDDEDD